jgi:hypothetical protein
MANSIAPAVEIDKVRVSKSFFISLKNLSAAIFLVVDIVVVCIVFDE